MSTRSTSLLTDTRAEIRGSRPAADAAVKVTVVGAEIGGFGRCMTTIRLIADDLTGALDTAAQFTCHLPMPVLLQREFFLSFRLLCTRPFLSRWHRGGCGRERPGFAAVFPGSALAFKKIDSLLRGHWAAEIAVLVASGVFRQMVLAPAFPDQGRITMGGRASCCPTPSASAPRWLSHRCRVWPGCSRRRPPGARRRDGPRRHDGGTCLRSDEKRRMTS